MKRTGPLLLLSALVALIASVTAWNRSHALADLVLRVVDLEQERRGLTTRNEVLKSAILQLDRASSPGPFLAGWIPDEDGGQTISWSNPRDGLYLVVSLRCAWCLPLLRDLGEIKRSFGSSLFVLSDDARGVDRFLDAEGESRPDVLIEPTGGWWDLAMPKKVTPIWLLYEDGVLVEFGFSGLAEEDEVGPSEAGN